MNTTSAAYSSVIRTMPKSVREFATYKSTIENCSMKTIEEYTLDLRTFFRYIVAARDNISLFGEEFSKINISDIDINYIRSITTEEIYEFLLYVSKMRENQWSARSRKLSALKSYFKFMTVKKHYLDTNPTQNIESPKRKKSLPKYLNIDECKMLLESVYNDTESKTKVRDHTIITLFLNCGMRLSELVGININDLDSELRCVKVTGKGAKERIIYLNSACKSSLQDYLSTRPDSDNIKLDNTKQIPLFLSSRNQRISAKTVQHVVYKYLKLSGLEYKGYSVHKLRHTAATLLYQSGNVDVRVLKDILGHEQLNTTQIYTHVSDESMETAMQQNPLANININK